MNKRLCCESRMQGYCSDLGVACVAQWILCSAHLIFFYRIILLWRIFYIHITCHYHNAFIHSCEASWHLFQVLCPLSAVLCEVFWNNSIGRNGHTVDRPVRHHIEVQARIQETRCKSSWRRVERKWTELVWGALAMKKCYLFSFTLLEYAICNIVCIGLFFFFNWWHFHVMGEVVVLRLS